GIDIAMLHRPGQRQRVGRGAQRRIGDVELETRGTTQRAEIADALILADALEDEVRPWIETLRGAQEIGMGIEAFRGKANPHQPLWRSPAAAPQPTGFPGEAQMQFRRMRLPGARTLAAPYLDHARQF